MNRARRFTSAAAAAALLCVMGQGAASAATELVVSSYLPEGLFNSRTVKRFGDLVTERTNGEVTFKYYFNAALANEKESLPLITSGGIDIGFIAASYYPANFPLTTLFDVPTLSNHMDATQRAVIDLYGANPAFKEEFERLNMKLLMITVADITPLGSNKRVESIDDIKGMRIRSTGTLAQIINAWGGAPVALGSTEIFQSMQSGLLDGFTAQPLQDFRAKSLDTVTKYAVDVGLGIYHTGFFVINKDSFAELSPEVQAIVEQAAVDANAVSNEINMENTRAAIPQTIANGLELYSVSDEVKAELQRVAREATTTAWVAQAVKSGIEETTAKSLLDQFMELTAKYDADPQTMNYWDIYQKEFAN